MVSETSRVSEHFWWSLGQVNTQIRSSMPSPLWNTDIDICNSDWIVWLESVKSESERCHRWEWLDTCGRDTIRDRLSWFGMMENCVIHMRCRMWSIWGRSSGASRQICHTPSPRMRILCFCDRRPTERMSKACPIMTGYWWFANFYSIIAVVSVRPP